MCIYLYVESCVNVSVSTVSPLIGRYCGTKIPPEIQSSSGLLSLSFHTDMAVAKDGFSARYNMTHKEVSDCEWKITFSCVCVLERSPCQVCLPDFIPVCVFSSFSAFFFSLSFLSADTHLFFLHPDPFQLFSLLPTLMLFQSTTWLLPLQAYSAPSPQGAWFLRLFSFRI